ncbi:spermatid nuclear transition protein 3 [Saccopteryx leptura]|uniref:spermatid nuclear transition protein 3 n=1 Tax=Saccopteryx leptura TaxID=249018 RepID=UPI00339C353F
MAKVTRKQKESSKIMKKSTSITKQRKQRKNPYQSRSRDGGKVKKIQRRIKRLLHGRSRKKSSRTSTKNPKKVKRIKRAKKFRPLTKIE